LKRESVTADEVDWDAIGGFQREKNETTKKRTNARVNNWGEERKSTWG